jgi:hypothetical protein
VIRFASGAGIYEHDVMSWTAPDVDDLPSQQPALTLVGGRPVHDPDGLLG